MLFGVCTQDGDGLAVFGHDGATAVPVDDLMQLLFVSIDVARHNFLDGTGEGNGGVHLSWVLSQRIPEHEL